MPSNSSGKDRQSRACLHVFSNALLGAASGCTTHCIPRLGTWKSSGPDEYPYGFAGAPWTWNSCCSQGACSRTDGSFWAKKINDKNGRYMITLPWQKTTRGCNFSATIWRRIMSDYLRDLHEFSDAQKVASSADKFSCICCKSSCSGAHRYDHARCQGIDFVIFL